MSRFTLEEEEQINSLKAFWASYGNFILTVLILVFGAFALRNGYEWYQVRQSSQSVTAFERALQAAQDKDIELLTRVQETLLNDFEHSPYAERGAVLAAKVFYEAGQVDQAKASLRWVVENGDLIEYVASARLTLASVLVEQNESDGAKALLEGQSAPGFSGLFLDRLADIYASEGNYGRAAVLYKESAEALDGQSVWQSVVERKIAALPAGK